MKKIVSLTLLLLTAYAGYSQKAPKKKPTNIPPSQPMPIPKSSPPEKTGPPMTSPPPQTESPKPKDEANFQLGLKFLRDRVAIYNTTSRPVSIILKGKLLSIKEGNPISTDTIKINGLATATTEKYLENPVVTIPTNYEQVTYTLITGKEYFVFWDFDKNRWDIKENKEHL